MPDFLLHHRFIRVARRQAGKPAIIDRTADRRLSYGKCLIAALLLADRFRSCPDGFLGIMLPTGAGCTLAVLGALFAGKTPVLINYSTGAADNARYAQRKCLFRTIVTARALLDKVGCPPVEGMIMVEDLLASFSAGERLKKALLTRLPLPMLLKQVAGGEPDDLLVVLFTSGSEKDPKAVPLTHRNIASNVAAFSQVFGLSHRDVMMASLPFFHIFGLTVNLWTPLFHGMTMVSVANPLEYRTICQVIREERPTMLAGTPSFLAGYLAKSAPGDFESLRIVVSGADKCPDSLREGFAAQHGITVYEGYGATETSPVISANSPGANRPGSVGRVLPGVEVRIEDYETGADCPPGKTGRILVRGELVMPGYLHDLEETSMRIRQGWYDTGDMGHLDADGFLWHAGRLRRFVKIGGEMISLVRVEDVLARQIAADNPCCVVEVPDPRKGSRIVAAVAAPVDEPAVLAAMAKELPNIALPRRFLALGDLPKMGSGKVDFRQVTSLVQERLAAGS
ncbi:MAG: AMP-binding protein [Thermodesulfobacteriota bacterium]